MTFWWPFGVKYKQVYKHFWVIYCYCWLFLHPTYITKYICIKTVFNFDTYVWLAGSKSNSLLFGYSIIIIGSWELTKLILPHGALSGFPFYHNAARDKRGNPVGDTTFGTRYLFIQLYGLGFRYWQRNQRLDTRNHWEGKLGVDPHNHW